MCMRIYKRTHTHVRVSGLQNHLGICAQSLQSRSALCNTMDGSPPGSSMGFSRQEYWSRLPCPPPGDLPDPGSQICISRIAGRFFTQWATRETLESLIGRAKFPQRTACHLHKYLNSGSIVLRSHPRKGKSWWGCLHNFKISHKKSTWLLKTLDIILILLVDHQRARHQTLTWDRGPWTGFRGKQNWLTGCQAQTQEV